MSTTIQADYTLVSWLEEAESALTSDLFLVSQLDNPEAPESEYVSRKLPYQQLCSLMLQDVGNLASAAASSYIGDLCAVVYKNKDGISAISDLLDDTVSAVIKMANCIQVNKSNISAISSFLLHNVEGKDGISVQLPLNLSSSSKLYIGHSGKIAATSTLQMKKFKYDSYGHITGIGDITSADILALGNIISGGRIGLSVNSTNKKVLDLKAATAAELGGVKIDNANASTYNLSILPNGTLSAATVDQNIGSIGLSGQLNYLTPSNGYVKQTIFRNDIYICENQEDEDKCRSEEVSLPKTIFRIDTNEWKEISESGHEETEHGRFNERIGIGRFIKNNITNKTFYVDVNSYPKVSELSSNIYDLPLAGNGILGGVKLCTDMTNTARRIYPLKLSGSYAYVSVDWKAGDADDAIEKVDELERSFLNNTLTASSTQTISSITQSRGNVTSIGKSTYLYDKIRELSAKVGSAESPNNLRFAFDNDTNVLSAKFNGTNTLIDKVQLNPYIISGAQTDTKLDEDGNVIDTGNFLKLIYNDYETRDENSAIYISLSSIEKDNSIGLSGQLNYLTPSNGYVKQTVFRNDIYICENQEDEDKSVGSGFTFKEVFDNWQKSGRYSNKVQGYTEYYVNPYSMNELFERVGAPDSILNAQPSSYNQLITEIPQPNWYLNVWHWTTESNFNPTTYTLYNYSLTSKTQTTEYNFPFVSQQAYGSEYWVYNSALCTIIQPMNTWDYACYISPENYTNYEMEVELASHNSDNDYIGIVAAFNTGSDGMPHQLNLIRVGGVNDKGWPSQDKPDNSLCTWYAEVDSSDWPQNNDSAYKTVTGLSVTDDDSSDPTKHKITRNWRDGGKTRIHVKRTGDILEAWTTRFYKDGEAIPTYEAKLTINLASVRTRGGTTYTCFSQSNGGGKIGFITNSQPMSFYKMISLTLDKQIIRTDTNELKIYHAGSITTQTGKWTDYAGIGRFIKNNATDKTFYVSDASFIKVTNANDVDDITQNVIENIDASDIIDDSVINDITQNVIENIALMHLI